MAEERDFSADEIIHAWMPEAFRRENMDSQQIIIG